MARPLRLHVPGMVYHVMSRGNDRQVIFTDDRDYERYLLVLDKGLRRFGVNCLAYCLMANHVHLLLQPGEHSISRLLQQVNSTYCQWFNRRHGRTGHVLQGRFKALLVETPEYLLTVLRYVLMNPVAAGEVAHPTQWKWSSLGASTGCGAAAELVHVTDLTSLTDGELTPGELRQRLLAPVDGGATDWLPAGPLHVGSTTFVKRFQGQLEKARTIRDFVRSERFAARPSLGELLGQSHARSELVQAARRAFREHAYTLAQIAAYVSRTPATVWRWAHAR